MIIWPSARVTCIFIVILAPNGFARLGPFTWDNFHRFIKFRSQRIERKNPAKFWWMRIFFQNKRFGSLPSSSSSSSSSWKSSETPSFQTPETSASPLSRSSEPEASSSLSASSSWPISHVSSPSASSLSSSSSVSSSESSPDPNHRYQHQGNIQWQTWIWAFSVLWTCCQSCQKTQQLTSKTREISKKPVSRPSFQAGKRSL